MYGSTNRDLLGLQRYLRGSGKWADLCQVLLSCAWVSMSSNLQAQSQASFHLFPAAAAIYFGWNFSRKIHLGNCSVAAKKTPDHYFEKKSFHFHPLWNRLKHKMSWVRSKFTETWKKCVFDNSTALKFCINSESERWFWKLRAVISWSEGKANRLQWI